MPTTDMSVGRMISYAFDRTGRGPQDPVEGTSRRTRRETMARGMLEYVLLAPKARHQLAKRIAETTGTPTPFRATSRTAGGAFDLVATIEDPDSEASGATIGVICRVDGEITAQQVGHQLGELGANPASRLVVITPRSMPLEDLPEDDRLRLTTWHRLAKRLADKDDKRAVLWHVLGEFGEDAGPLGVHRPVSPRILLDEETTSAFRAHLDTMRLVASELFGRPARFSAGLRREGAHLHVGASGEQLGAEFGPVEDASPVWLVGARPARSFPLRIGALTDEESRRRAESRLRAIAAGEAWRTDPSYEPRIGELIGEAAGGRIEDARSLLWDVFDPRRLAAAGFPPAARNQPGLEEDRLSFRVTYPADPRAGTFLVSIGGSRTWKTLLPRVTREYDDKTYIVQASKGDTAEEFVRHVHEALRSLATKP